MKISRIFRNISGMSNFRKKKFPLMSLPDELLMNVFEYLDNEDRQTLRNIRNYRLIAVEKMTGNRHFSEIQVTPGTITASDGSRTFFNACPLDEAATFYRHASTTELWIEGEFDSIDERRLRIALKTLVFQKLVAIVNSDYSARLIIDLVRGSRHIEKLTILWEDSDQSAESAKQVFMALPSMKQCEIFENVAVPVIDDDILIHLLNMTSQHATISLPNTVITASGVAKAFEIICNSPIPIRVSFFVPYDEFHLFTYRVDGKYIGTRCILHEKSGAQLEYEPVYRGKIFSRPIDPDVADCEQQARLFDPAKLDPNMLFDTQSRHIQPTLKSRVANTIHWKNASQQIVDTLKPEVVAEERGRLNFSLSFDYENSVLHKQLTWRTSTLLSISYQSISILLLHSFSTRPLVGDGRSTIMRPATTSRNVERLGWTVHKRRRAQAIKAGKRSDRNADLITRLQIMTKLSIPERLGEIITNNIHSLVTNLGWYDWTRDWLDIKASCCYCCLYAVQWIVATVWAHLPQEKNKKVLTNLLRLGNKLIYQRPFAYSNRGRKRNSNGGVPTSLKILEQKVTSAQRRLAIKLLFASFSNANMDKECHHRIVRVCLLHVKPYASWPISDVDVDTVDHLMICLMLGVHSGSFGNSTMPLEAILENEYVLPFIFEGLRSAQGELHAAFVSVLDTILSRAQPPARVTLIVRYYRSLQEAFVIFLHFRDRSYYHIYLRFMQHNEFAAMIATTPSILNILSSEIRWYSKYDGKCHWNEKFCNVIVAALGSVLDNDRMLQEILGYGVLVMVKYYSQHPFDTRDGNPRRTEIFRTILERFPCWRRHFREWTEDAVAGSVTARIGRSFPVNVRTRGVDYIFEQEDGQLD